MTENNNLRKCSRCHATKLEEYFSTNTKGELYKLCDNCRNKGRHYYKVHYEDSKDKIKEYNKKSYNKFLEKPIEEQYVICDRCNNKVHLKYEGMSRHLKRWNCVKATMETEPGREEFFKWVYENKDNLLRDYQKYISRAE